MFLNALLHSPYAEPSLMGMPHAAEPWTAERVRALPDDGQRYELIEGQLVVTPAPQGRHQLVLAELYDRLRPYLGATGAGKLLWSPADIALGEDEILQPDLFVYRTADGSALGYWHDITELVLVIEALSPATARYDRELKRRRYQRAGVPEYWIVDLDSRLVERWRPDDTRPEVLFASMPWQPPGASEPLTLDLAGLWNAVHR